MNIKELFSQEDKKKHFIAGCAILSFFILVAPQYAFIMPGIIGVLKEVVWDKLLGKGTPDVWDAVVTAIPGLFGLLYFL